MVPSSSLGYFLHFCDFSLLKTVSLRLASHFFSGLQSSFYGSALAIFTPCPQKAIPNHLSKMKFMIILLEPFLSRASAKQTHYQLASSDSFPHYPKSILSSKVFFDSSKTSLRAITSSSPTAMDLGDNFSYLSLWKVCAMFKGWNLSSFRSFGSVY